MKDDVEKEINDFLDSMPPMTRITIPDLVSIILSKNNFIDKGMSVWWMKRYVGMIARSRKDFSVIRQKGICKWVNPNS